MCLSDDAIELLEGSADVGEDDFCNNRRYCISDLLLYICFAADKLVIERKTIETLPFQLCIVSCSTRVPVIATRRGYAFCKHVSIKRKFDSIRWIHGSGYIVI